MRLIIETDGEFAPMFRAVAKAVNAKVKIMDDDSKVKEKHPKVGKGPFIDPSSAGADDKPSDFFKGAWENDPSRTAQSIRKAAWRRKN